MTATIVDTPLEYVVSRQPFVVRRTVKWTECDPAGVVYTGRFVDYVTSAQLLFLTALFGKPLRETVIELQADFPAKAISFVFDRALWPDDAFDTSVRVSKIGNSTFETQFDAAAVATGEHCFSACMTTICIFPTERRSVRVPDTLRNLLAAHLTAS